MPAPPPSRLDANQVLQHAFEESTGRLRTDSTATVITPPEIKVEIDAATDSIRLGDGTDLTTTTTVGPKVGLDVNILNSGLTLPNLTTVSNVSALVANTEYSYSVPANTKKILIRSRNNSRIQLGFTVGASGTNYITISPGCNYTIDGIDFTGTLYFQASKASEIIEIQCWHG